MAIKWGIIGVGNVAEVKSGPAFQKAENSELLAVMRRNAAKAEDFAKRHQVPAWYNSVDEIISHPDLNAIYVSSPPLYHEEHAIKAMLAGKDVYLEKPMAINTAACKRIIKVAKESGRKLTIAHYRRRLPAFLKVRDLLLGKAIGAIRFAEIRILQPVKSDIITTTEDNWRVNPEISGGGLFHDIGPHQIDLMLQYFGEPSTYSGSSSNQAGLYLADDMVIGTIAFKSGVLFQGCWAFSFGEKAEPMEECNIYGTDGSIHFSFYGNQVILKKSGNEQRFNFENPENIQLPMIQKTVNYFLGNEATNPCSSEEALQGLEVMESFCK